MTRIAIGSRVIGHGEPTYVIAEAGVNHDGDLNRALALVDMAADAGADAVKFQTFTPSALVVPGAPQAPYQRDRQPAVDQLAMLTSLALGPSDLRLLSDHATSRSIAFLSTPFDDLSVSQLEDIPVPAWKVSSGDVTNHPLLRRIARNGRPVILSTGMATLEEVRDAVRVLRTAGTADLALLHCISSYPTPPHAVNLRAMDALATIDAKAVTGYSDHCLGPLASIAAVARGASIIERHITLDRTLPGPDHALSLEPDELAALIASIRTIESMLGSGRKEPSPVEADVMVASRRSIVAAHDLEAGQIVTEQDLAFRRPGTGIPPSRLPDVTGRRLRVAVAKDSLLSDEHLTE